MSSALCKENCDLPESGGTGRVSFFMVLPSGKRIIKVKWIAI